MIGFPSLISAARRLASRLQVGVLWPLESYLSGRFSDKFASMSSQKKIVLTLVPLHTNLGDHAIACAAREIMAIAFPEYSVIELDMAEIYRYARAVRSALGPHDMVFLLGGGNMNDWYHTEEWTRRFVIRTFRNWRVVSLPQTASFSASRGGRMAATRSARVYGSHPNLLLFARDRTSQAFMSARFGRAKVVLFPDLVLSMDRSRPLVRRAGIATSLRTDREGILSESQRRELLRELERCFGPLAELSTRADGIVRAATRTQKLEDLWSRFRLAEVVVTDRLHGVLFSVITGTPCVALPTFDHKLREAFDWLADVRSAKLLTSNRPQDVCDAVEALRGTGGERPALSTDRMFRHMRELVLGPG